MRRIKTLGWDCSPTKKCNQMSRRINPHRTDNSHMTPQLPKANPAAGESQASKNYTAGKAFRYAYRINGPVFPVTITQAPLALSDDVKENESDVTTS